MVFIEDFLGKDIGLVDMAAVVGYSPDHFARLFRQTFRVSPYQYLLAVASSERKMMLRDRRCRSRRSRSRAAFRANRT